jgi:pimeloyl-ACP methyl ester carboxylesterase
MRRVAGDGVNLAVLFREFVRGEGDVQPRVADLSRPAGGADAPVRRARHRPVALRADRGASHWMQLDAPARVNDLLLEFLG